MSYEKGLQTVPDILEAIEKIGEWKECPLTNLLKTQRLYAVKEF